MENFDLKKYLAEGKLLNENSKEYDDDLKDKELGKIFDIIRQADIEPETALEELAIEFNIPFEFGRASGLGEGQLNEAPELDMAKSYLENQGLEVETVTSGNDGEAKASKFKGVSNPEADKTAYIWDGGEGDSNYKSNGKEAFYVYMPYNEDIKKEMDSKFPILDTGGKSGTYYTLTIEKK